MAIPEQDKDLYEEVNNENEGILNEDFTVDDDEAYRDINLRGISEEIQRELNKLTFEYKGKQYHGDPKSTLLMASALAMASQNSFRVLATQMKAVGETTPSIKPLADLFNAVYNGVYVETHLPWKTVDGKMSNINMEDLSSMLTHVSEGVKQIYLKNAVANRT